MRDWRFGGPSTLSAKRVCSLLNGLKSLPSWEWGWGGEANLFSTIGSGLSENLLSSTTCLFVYSGNTSSALFYIDTALSGLIGSCLGVIFCVGWWMVGGIIAWSPSPASSIWNMLSIISNCWGGFCDSMLKIGGLVLEMNPVEEFAGWFRWSIAWKTGSWCCLY
jgi:hypothetical protein